MRSDMIEIDLHRTLDGDVVIAHDADLKHLGARAEIAELTTAELRALDAGQGERVPMLHEVLDRFGDRIPFNLEIKHSDARGQYVGLEQVVLEELRPRGLMSETLFSSFYDDVLDELRELDEAARLAVLLSPRAPQKAIERAHRVGAEAVNPHVLLATADLIDAAHADGLAVHVYTVDDEDSMKRLIDLGVDGIFTNHPDRMRRVVDGVSPAPPGAPWAPRQA
jgi:glycerophosphoryl diester phosphodiesterase